MAELPDFPNFNIKPVSADKLRQMDSGKLALRPGFWEGPGTAVETGEATFLGAFSGTRPLGYLGVRGVAVTGLSPATAEGLKELLRTERLRGILGTSALETEPWDDDATVAYNLAFAQTGPKGRGVGTALFRAAFNHIARDAATTQPAPVYLTVAHGNPSVHLYNRLGFMQLARADGTPLTTRSPYYQPPSADGVYGEPEERDYLYMGIILTRQPQGSAE